MLGFILNIPYTLTGLFVGAISIPQSITWNAKPVAIILHVKKFWWTIGFKKYSRAITIGHVVLLGPHIEEKDLEHELVHVRQHMKMPLVFPILYFIENARKGYRQNKYEKEAYQKAGNIYKE